MSPRLTELEHLAYPGRLILIGLDRAGKNIAVAYGLTGRSASSQARKLRLRGKDVWTEATEEEMVQKGREDLLIYRAMALGTTIIVSNGRQTDSIVQASGKATEPEDILRKGLEGWTYEPDAPHFTPRISGCVSPDRKACLSIIKRGRDEAEERLFFPWVLEPGRGKMIATYSGRDDNPLPSFDRPPVDLAVASSDAPGLAREVYGSLAPRPSGPDYRVAVAAVFAPIGNFLDFRVHIINRRDLGGNPWEK